MNEYKPTLKFCIEKDKFTKGTISFCIGLNKETYEYFTERYLLLNLGKIGLAIGWIIK